jgi:adenosylmethionine-8-amino-7-oxononanoate aminotransferase
LRRPYEGWLGRFRPRLGRLSIPGGLARGKRARNAGELAAELNRAFTAAGPGTVAAFVAEPIVGATLAAAVPPEGYWPAIAEVCREHDVLSSPTR